MAQFRDDLTGPQLHASQVFRQMLAAAQRAGYLRGVKTPPPLIFNAPVAPTFLGGQPAYAQAYVGPGFQSRGMFQGAISFSPHMQADLIDPNARYRDYALGSIIHELAHTRQNPAALTNRVWTEGGADAFARIAANPAIRASGLTRGFSPGVYSGAAPYTPYVQAVKDAFTKRWITQGQFTPGALASNYSRLGPPLPPRPPGR